MRSDRGPSAVRWVLWAVLAVVWSFLAVVRFNGGESGWGWLTLLLAAAWAALAVRERRRWQRHLQGDGSYGGRSGLR